MSDSRKENKYFIVNQSKNFYIRLAGPLSDAEVNDIIGFLIKFKISESKDKHTFASREPTFVPPITMHNNTSLMILYNFHKEAMKAIATRNDKIRDLVAENNELKKNLEDTNQVEVSLEKSVRPSRSIDQLSHSQQNSIKETVNTHTSQPINKNSNASTPKYMEPDRFTTSTKEQLPIINSKYNEKPHEEINNIIDRTTKDYNTRKISELPRNMPNRQSYNPADRENDVADDDFPVVHANRSNNILKPISNTTQTVNKRKGPPVMPEYNDTDISPVSEQDLTSDFYSHSEESDDIQKSDDSDEELHISDNLTDSETDLEEDEDSVDEKIPTLGKRLVRQVISKNAGSKSLRKEPEVKKHNVSKEVSPPNKKPVPKKVLELAPSKKLDVKKQTKKSESEEPLLKKKNGKKQESNEVPIKKPIPKKPIKKQDSDDEESPIKKPITKKPVGSKKKPVVESSSEEESGSSEEEPLPQKKTIATSKNPSVPKKLVKNTKISKKSDSDDDDIIISKKRPQKKITKSDSDVDMNKKYSDSETNSESEYDSDT